MVDDRVVLFMAEAACLSVLLEKLFAPPLAVGYTPGTATTITAPVTQDSTLRIETMVQLW